MSGKVKYPYAVKQLARELRASGASISDIVKQLGVASSTATEWVRGIQVSLKVRRELDARMRNHEKAQAAVRQIVAARRDQWRREAEAMWPALRADPQFMLCLGLWWGEGSKRQADLSVCNSDPGLLSVWVLTFRRLIPTADFKVRVQAHDDLDFEKVRAFWQSAIGTDAVRVNLSKTHSKRPNARKLRFGTAVVTLRKGSSEWFHKMHRFLQLLLADMSLNHLAMDSVCKTVGDGFDPHQALHTPVAREERPPPSKR